jgi:hypothetical protein
MLAPIVRDPRVEDLVVAALDDVDGVDLHVAEVLDRGADRLRASAEWRGFIEALRTQPDATGLGLGKRFQGSLISAGVTAR